MPLPRSEHAVAEFGGKIWVLGGYPPGRLPSNLDQVYDPATSRRSLGPSLPTPSTTPMSRRLAARSTCSAERLKARAPESPNSSSRMFDARPGGRRVGGARADAHGARAAAARR
jgi:hypothetical protein